jgi:hypothetical protein
MMEEAILQNLYLEELYNVKEKVVVIISKPWEEISFDDRTLLSKILGSVKLSLPSVQIKEYEEFSIADFHPRIPTHIIAFGARLKSVSKKYEQLTIENTSVVLADELTQLDDLKKRSLWLALKQIFQC